MHSVLGFAVTSAGDRWSPLRPLSSMSAVDVRRWFDDVTPHTAVPRVPADSEACRDDVVEEMGLSPVDHFVGPPQGIALGTEKKPSIVGLEAVRVYPALPAARAEQLS
jgi:hypothetical protein